MLAHGTRIEVFYEPRDAPELNATEYLNTDEKGPVNAAGFPNDKKELRSRMQQFMHKLHICLVRVRHYFKRLFRAALCHWTASC